MIKKTLVLFIFLSTQAYASDKGIHVLFDINSDEGDRAAVGTTDYYFQDGNLRAEVNLTEGAVGNVTMIQNGDKLYTLFPKDKTYMEVPEFVSSAAANLTKQKETGKFTKTKQTKKIAGYDCTVYKKETKTTTDTVCVNQPLYNQYKDLFVKMNKMMANQNSFASVQGFPLEAVSLGKGKQKTKTSILVKKIDQQNYAGKFDLPKDYTQKNMISGAADMLKKIQEASEQNK